MQGQAYKVSAQLETYLASPKNVYYMRDQRKYSYAQICHPRFFTAYRCKAKAIEQSANTDGHDNRHYDSAEERLEEYLSEVRKIG